MAPQEQHEGACCRPQTSLESIPTWREQRSKMEAEAATTTDASELDEEAEIVIRPGALRVSMEGVTEPGIGIDEDDGHTQMTIATTAPEEAAPEQNHSLIVAELAPKDRDIDALAAERDALKQSLQAQRDNVAEAEIVEEKTICGFQRKRAICCFVLIAMALVATIAGVTASKKAKGTLIEVTESPTVSLAPSESPSASPTETPLFEIPNPEQCEAIASGNGPTETTGEAYGFFLNIHAFVKNPTTFDDDLSGGLLEKLQSIVAPQIARCPKPNSRRLEDKLDPAKIKTEGGLSKVLIENALFVRVFEGPNSCEEDNTDLCFSFYADLLVLAQTDWRLLVFDFREVVLEALELLGEKIELVERFSLFNMYEVRAASPPQEGITSNSTPAPSIGTSPGTTGSPIPVPAPIKSPTAAPTKEEDEAGFDHPTKSQTKYPSSSPTHRPTNKPSVFPTSYPTSRPSMSLTSRLVTGAPTSKQPDSFVVPTLGPTLAPNPSLPSTPSATSPPNFPPMSSHTLGPVSSPTFSPTKRSPTNKPTPMPTKRPTDHPTESPTKRPTQVPTKRPTDHPTKSPTKNPTPFPTEQSLSIASFFEGGDYSTTSTQEWGNLIVGTSLGVKCGGDSDIIVFESGGAGFGSNGGIDFVGGGDRLVMDFYALDLYLIQTLVSGAIRKVLQRPT